MRFDVHLPCEQLLPYIKHFVISENEQASSYTVLPDIALVIGFQYRGKMAYLAEDKTNPLATAGITGFRDSYRVFQNTAGVGSVLVVFRQSGAARFLKTPLHELFGESLSLEQFFSRASLIELEEKLITAADDTFRIRLVEQFLIRNLDDRQPDLMVNRALEHIFSPKARFASANWLHCCIPAPARSKSASVRK